MSINLIKMFQGLPRERAVELAARLRRIAESTTEDNQLASAVQAEYENFTHERNGL